MQKFTQQKLMFTNALDRFNELLHPTNMVERDALIQRFEFTFDLGWKTLKSLLLEKYSVDAPTPLQAFQEAVRLELISENEIWLKMRDMRNLTSHSYSELTAAELAAQAPDFSKAFITLQILFAKE